MGAAGETIKDPGSFLDPNKQNISGAIDPGGEIVGGVFGEKAGKIARRIADPLGILPGAVTPGPTVEDLIRARSPQAINELTTGAEEAARLSGEGTAAAIGELQPFTGSQAFQEQAALLGALGPEAQAAAIQGIPFSGVNEERNLLEQRRLKRQAAAQGRLGAGSTIAGLTDLGAAQQGRTIAERLGALSPISDITRGAASTISGLSEADLTRQAQLLAGLGPQQAQILLGGAADIVGARSTASELAGLQDISQANQLGSLVSQGAQFAGQRFGGTTPTSTGQQQLVTPQNPSGLTQGQGL